MTSLLHEHWSSQTPLIAPHAVEMVPACTPTTTSPEKQAENNNAAATLTELDQDEFNKSLSH